MTGYYKSILIKYTPSYTSSIYPFISDKDCRKMQWQHQKMMMKKKKRKPKEKRRRDKSICQLHPVDNPSQAVLLSQHIGLGLGGGGVFACFSQICRIGHTVCFRCIVYFPCHSMFGTDIDVMTPLIISAN